MTTVWNRLKEQGQIKTGTFGGWYSVREERYVSNKEIEIDAMKNYRPVRPDFFNGEKL